MRILIVEDESRIAKRIEGMTRDIFGDRLQSLKRIDTLQEALRFIEANPLDLVFLDLNLNGNNGFELLGTAVSKSFHTIIISAYKNQAITAFEYGVLDFVPKPFNQDRLAQAIKRITTKTLAENKKTKFLAIRKKGRVVLVSVEDVLYIKGAGSYTELFLSGGRKELHGKSLEKLEQLLSTSFERIHKSYLVKLAEIDKITVASGSKYMAELRNGESIPIGRTKYKDLKRKWL